MAVNEEFIRGMKTWLGARILGAINSDNKSEFLAFQLLLEDVNQSAKNGEYPWEVIFRGYVDRAAKDTEMGFREPEFDEFI
jgi:hypothetical protein